jgi:tRNA (guanine37-N1)-methyltransferase
VHRQSVSIKVPRKYAQQTIILVNKMKLINKDLEIQKDGGFVWIPFLRHPSKNELETFKQQGIKFKILSRDFPEKAKKIASFIDLLNDKLPPNLLASLPHAFDIIGDIAVMEIPPELSAYETTIGEAVLKANKNLRTVLSKSGAVGGTYRLREYNMLAGEPKTHTLHKEYGCQYYVDLAKAYFSPRLSNEHHRVASLVREGETVLDLFAGVGPFAVQIAKTHQNVGVYAVDVNPWAVEFLERNIRLNRVEEKVFPVLGDARQVVKERFSRVADRVVMNLPEKAAEFIDVACDAVKPMGGVVHFYRFINVSEPLEGVSVRFVESVEKFGRRVDKPVFSRLVRATAPYEWQAVLDVKIR